MDEASRRHHLPCKAASHIRRPANRRWNHHRKPPELRWDYPVLEREEARPSSSSRHPNRPGISLRSREHERPEASRGHQRLEDQAEKLRALRCPTTVAVTAPVVTGVLDGVEARAAGAARAVEEAPAVLPPPVPTVVLAAEEADI